MIKYTGNCIIVSIRGKQCFDFLQEWEVIFFSEFYSNKCDKCLCAVGLDIFLCLEVI